MNTVKTSETQMTGIIQQDLRTYKQVSLKGFARLGNKKKTEIKIWRKENIQN